ncbi:MAG: response regulator [Myxococcota bacterium]|nr:response regulator [Myxococcota bacterium]
MTDSTHSGSKSPEVVSGSGTVPVLDLGLIGSIFHTSPDFLVCLDEEARVTYINQIFSEHGDPSISLGDSFFDSLTASSHGQFREAMAQAKDGGDVDPVEIQMQQGVWLQVRLFPVWQEEQFDGYVLVSSDISKLKDNQQRLEREKRDLEAEISMQSATLAEESERRFRLEQQMVNFGRLEGLANLASGVAHEYNNLLSVILGNAGLAQMLLPRDSPAREAIQHLETATLHAAELTNQLLTYSGFARVKTERLNLSQCVKELTALIEVGLKEGRTLDLCCDPNLPQTLGDLGQIQQVLMHLIQQASSNLGGESGTISIRTRSVSLGNAELNACAFRLGLEPGVYAALEVADQGRRLTEEEVTHFFDPYSPHRSAGTGMGIAAVLGIVRSYGGTLMAASGEEGNRVSLFFPLFPDSDAAIERNDAPILLVDDEFAVRVTVGSLLNQLGYQVVEVASGQDAVDHLCLDEHPCTLMLLDANLVGMSGVAAFDAVRNRYPDLPVVVMSGASERRTLSQFRGRNISGFLKKPFRFSDLKGAVESALESS